MLCVIGVVLTGRKKSIGWFVFAIAQVLYVIFGIITGQWGFVLSAPIFFVLDIKYWLEWRKEPQIAQKEEATIT